MKNTLKTLLLAAGIGLSVAGCSTDNIDVKIPKGSGYILYHQRYKHCIDQWFESKSATLTYFPDSTRKDSEVFYDENIDGIGNDNDDYYSKTVIGDMFRTYKRNEILLENLTRIERDGTPFCDSVVAVSRKVLEEADRKYSALKGIVLDSLGNRIGSKGGN